MKRLGRNLIPFPRLHFFLSIAPISGSKYISFIKNPGLVVGPYTEKLKTYQQIPNEVIDLCCKYLEGQIGKSAMNVKEFADSMWSDKCHLANLLPKLINI